MAEEKEETEKKEINFLLTPQVEKAQQIEGKRKEPEVIEIDTSFSFLTCWAKIEIPSGEPHFI